MRPVEEVAIGRVRREQGKQAVHVTTIEGVREPLDHVHRGTP